MERRSYTLLEGGIERFIRFDKSQDFIGKAALLAEKEAGVKKAFVTMTVDAPFADAPYMSTIWNRNEVVGETTSGDWGFLALAAGAVVVLAVSNKSVSWVSLGLTVSWGLYALAKKQLPIGPNQGFLLEVLILLVPALAYVTWLGQGQNHFELALTRDTLLLAGCGIVMAVPLLLYANGAKGLQLTTIAIMQYMAPTLIFLVAVFAFGEEFGRTLMIALPMIWAALVIYCVSMFRKMRVSGSL